MRSEEIEGAERKKGGWEIKSVEWTHQTHTLHDIFLSSFFLSLSLNSFFFLYFSLYLMIRSSLDQTPFKPFFPFFYYLKICIIKHSRTDWHFLSSFLSNFSLPFSPVLITTPATSLPITFMSYIIPLFVSFFLSTHWTIERGREIRWKKRREMFIKKEYEQQ